MTQPDFVIAGAGLIGLTLALELETRGASVTVLEAGQAMRQASSAAAGMLAAEDPANPPGLRPLAQLSAGIYAAFLDSLEERTGRKVAFQTTSTLQAVEPGEDSSDKASVLADPRQVVPAIQPGAHRFSLLQEFSVDPQQLAQVVLTAVQKSNIDLREETSLLRVRASESGVELTTAAGKLSAAYLIDCMGAWSPARMVPRKGQMLMVQQPAGLDLETVLRTDTVYLVPRTEGPNAGRIVIGATVEDAGFDLAVHPRDVLQLHARAVELLPDLASAAFVGAWAGLRPAAPDGLPVLGATAAQPRYLVAGGHFRNGILLAPATARVIAGMLYNEPPPVDLEPFDPDRFNR